tara:strand:- start:15701 stop:16495 length:795 start_codon:yes stop_codon:yes gene_type:complete
MELVKELQGHSGCHISLAKSDTEGLLLVRKISRDKNYNFRLEQQFHKQKEFNHPKINTPKVYSSGFAGDLFYFDMEYIEGRSLQDFITTNHPEDSIKILKSVFRIHEGNEPIQSNTLMQSKIKKLKSRLHDDMHSFLDYCADFDWSILPSSYCHGDLSFENIIIKNNKIYLIDFLDSFLSSSFIDKSKLFLDLMTGWSWRKNNNVPLIKNIIILKQFQDSWSHQDKEIYKRLIPFQLLRILPYSTTPVIKDFLLPNFRQLLKHL